MRRSARLSSSALGAAATLVLALSVASGCQHKCEKDGGSIPAELTEAGVVMEGAEACEFGAATDDALMNHIAFVKVYHSGYFKENGLKYLDHLEGKGWERVACAGGLGTTNVTEHRMTECMKKDRLRVRLEFYDFDGTALDIDLLELKTPEEVVSGG
ncbi:MAG: hypothetical protein KC486_01675 [Myxococcales bacterium]|nr:hypothetical protein [Myxococcales bacterium]